MTRLPRSGLICAPPGRPLSKPAAIQVITLRSARKNSEILKSTANVHSNLKKKLVLQMFLVMIFCQKVSVMATYES